MAIESIRSDLSLPLKEGINKLEKISDDEMIQLIVEPIKSEKNRARAARQIKIYLKKIIFHPEKSVLYSELIKNLIQFEKKEKSEKK